MSVLIVIVALFWLITAALALCPARARARELARSDCK